MLAVPSYNIFHYFQDNVSIPGPSRASLKKSHGLALSSGLLICNYECLLLPYGASAYEQPTWGQMAAPRANAAPVLIKPGVLWVLGGVDSESRESTLFLCSIS